MNGNRQVKDIAGYLKEVSEIKAKWPNSTLVFRGQEDEEWPLASSAERRLKTGGPSRSKIPDQLFIEYHEDLLTKCKLKNYDKRAGKQLEDLELLADLQHHRAATCLIDFTRNALVALWFACEKSDADGKVKSDADGKVFVINTTDEKAFWEINTDKDKSIRKILEFKTREIDNDHKKDEPPKTHDTDKYQEAEFPTPEPSATLPNKPSFWYWTPAHLNERITAQHSLFLFGLPSSGDLNSEEILIESASKEQIRRELEELHDIREESLFPDFVGFAYTQRSNAPYPTPSAEEYFHSGVTAQQRGQYSEAIQDLTKAIESKEDYAEAYLIRGGVYLSKNEYDQAIQDLTKAIQLKEDYAEAYLIRGGVYLSKNEYDQAIQDLTKAIQLKEDYAEAYAFRGLAYACKGEYDQAIQDLTKAIELKEDAEAYLARGLAYRNKGEYDQAIQDLTKAIELKEDAEAYLARGLAYRSKGEYDQAIQDLTKAIELKEDAEAYLARGLTWLHLEKWQEAKSDLTAAKDMGLDIVASFSQYTESVANFEQITGTKLPEDIAAMLTESEN